MIENRSWADERKHSPVCSGTGYSNFSPLEPYRHNLVRPKCAKDTATANSRANDPFQWVAGTQLDAVAVRKTDLCQRLMPTLFKQLGRLLQIHCAEIGEHGMPFLSGSFPV